MIHDTVQLSLAMSILERMFCHSPAWLFVLCKPCRGIGSPGAHRGLNPFRSSSHPMLAPPTKQLMSGRGFAGVAEWWAPMWWLLCLVALQCCGFSPTCWRETALPSPYSSFCIAKGAMQEHEGGGCKGRPMGGGITVVYLSTASKSA